ncbi:MAG: DUF938 domain-containing protein [Pseudomonadota bacterium]
MDKTARPRQLSPMTDSPSYKDQARPIALEDRAHGEDARLFSPSVGRNKDVIAETFAAHVGDGAHVLEIGSGTGEHGAHICKRLPGVRWRPSDPDPASRASIAAWADAEGLCAIAAPVAIDATATVWGVEDDAPFDAVVSINMIHIAPYAAALGLFAGAGRLLRPDGILFLYGPFMRGGAHTSPSNEDFDMSLKSKDPGWGVRDMDALAEDAASHGLVFDKAVDMPANNFVVLFRKTAST